jgi:8-oxo-dGTP diphosphatase
VVTSRSTTIDAGHKSEVVHAAGGLIVRRAPTGACEVLVVHRPTRCDWSFPKGKLNSGETFEHGAVREVREETGFVCNVGRFIGHTEYRDRKDRPKVVAYWVMQPLGEGAFTPSEEVDEIRWVELDEASRLLSYDRDKELLVVLAATDEVAPLV